jgi:hypothetical protein
LLARLGGDEFALLVPNGDRAETLAARAIGILGQPFLVEGHRVTIGASIGIARFSDHGPLADDLMRQADFALNHAKSSGGQSWRMFDGATASKGRHDIALARGSEADENASTKGICSTRLNDGVPFQHSANRLIRIEPATCCGANDGSNGSEKIGTPV